MKTKEIKTACKRVKAFVNTSRPTLPILACVKIESNGSSLAMTAYNMEVGVGIVVTLPDASAGTFATCVKFADLEKIIGKLKSDSLELSATERTETTCDRVYNAESGRRESVSETEKVIDLTVRSAGLSFTLNGRPASDFPILPGPSGDILASTACEYGRLAGELAFVLKATNHDTPRNFTSGVLFDFRPETLILVGTDGRRLHEAKITGPHTQDSESPIKSFLPPVMALDSLLKLNLDPADMIELAFYEALLCWKAPDAGVSGVIHLLDTPYPDYEKVIPEMTNVFRLDSKVTVQALDALSIIAHEHDGRDMVVINANGRLNLSVKSETVGKADADLPLTHVQGGPDTLVALNIDYFTDILKACESRDGSMTMSNADPLEPCRFDYPDSDRIAVLMPVRLPE